jgi:hypothetical protein
MQPLTLATEDALSEAIAERILADYPSILIGSRIRRGGNGYLRSNMRAWIEIARHAPVLVVTDLDNTFACPPALLADWLGSHAAPRRLLLRVAVRESEAWLLADHYAMITLLGRRIGGRLPDAPDALTDPKTALLDLAVRAPRDVRLDLRAESGSTARQGLGYNTRLVALVRNLWNPARAAERSPSLRRAIARISELAP